ncbi:MAG: VOC family protein [Proteobacteria bacterium]|nr:VOC family protein [Pseudomonadota bacterium]
MTAFHLAFPVRDLDSTRQFYVDLLGCKVGRVGDKWIDFDFFGHQITAHRVADSTASTPPKASGLSSEVDGKSVPVPHFGAVLDWQAWHQLVDRLRAAGVAFVLEPQIRFAGQSGEQATLFIADPSGNHLEFKSLKNPAELFPPD